MRTWSWDFNEKDALKLGKMVVSHKRRQSICNPSNEIQRPQKISFQRDFCVYRLYGTPQGLPRD